MNNLQNQNGSKWKEFYSIPTQEKQEEVKEEVKESSKENQV